MKKTSIGMLNLGRLIRFAMLLMTGLMTGLTAFGQTIFINEALLQVNTTDNCAESAEITGRWSAIDLTDLPRKQVFCFRASVPINQEKSGTAISLSLSLLGASEVYWDRQLIGKNGKVGLNRDTESPGFIDALFPIPDQLLSKGNHQLVIRASTFFIEDQQGPVFFGLRVIETARVHQYLMQSSWLATFVMGGLLVIGLLFQLFFWLYQAKTYYQVFSVLCFSAALLLLTEKWRAMFGYTYDLHQLRMSLVMIFTYLLGLLLPAFYLFYYQLSRKFMWLAVTAFVFSCLIVQIDDYDSRGIAMFFTMLVVSLLINLMALKNKTLGARLNSLIIVCALVVFFTAPTDFTEDRFTVTLFAIVLVMLTNIIREMKFNRVQALASIRLQAELLKRNLQPHFLMNSLMLVIEWIEQKPEAAASFVQALAEELRMLVKFSDLSLVSLQDELLLCRRHMEIMSYRYKIDCKLEVQGDVDGIRIPPAVIHTQIENFFSHNHVSTDSTFQLTVTRSGELIELELITPFDKKVKPDGAGIGERYIHSRLAEIFGQQYSYRSYSSERNNIPYEKDEARSCWVNCIEFRNPR